MSNELDTATSAGQLIEATKAKFIEVLRSNNTGVSYDAESMFAFQALNKSDYALGVALNNKMSVYNAIVNIAAIGLSLNPATSYAYLVPRDGAICLDISYQGLIKIATDSGSIKWAKAELVYDTDNFVYNGVGEEPVHTTNPFSKERGELVGVYCIAKTADGDFLVETMTAEEVYKIRDESASIKNAKTDYARKMSPWVRYEGEMIKKTCIKRASKTWPKTERSDRLQAAISVVNETEGSDWNLYTESEKEDFHAWVRDAKGATLYRLQKKDMEKFIALSNTAEYGEKGKFKARIGEVIEESNAMILDCWNEIVAMLETDDINGINEILAELDKDETFMLNQYFQSEHTEKLRSLNLEEAS